MRPGVPFVLETPPFNLRIKFPSTELGMLPPLPPSCSAFRVEKESEEISKRYHETGLYPYDQCIAAQAVYCGNV